MMTLVVVMGIVAAGVLVFIRAFSASTRSGLQRSRPYWSGDSASSDSSWIVGGFGGDTGGSDSDCSSSDSGGGSDGGGCDGGGGDGGGGDGGGGGGD